MPGKQGKLAVGSRGGIGHKPNCVLNSKDHPRQVDFKAGYNLPILLRYFIVLLKMGETFNLLRYQSCR